jgi:hypothetical protein
VKALPQVIPLGKIRQGAIERLLPTAHAAFNLTEGGCRGHKCAAVEEFAALPPHAFGAFIPGIDRYPETFPAFECDRIAFTSLLGLDQGHDAGRERRRGKDEGAGHGCGSAGHIHDQCSWIDFPRAKHGRK